MPAQRAYRRHHRARVIARRLRIVAVWDATVEDKWRPVPGRFAKFNLACGCGLCTEADRRRAEKRERRRERRYECKQMATWVWDQEEGKA